MKTLISEKVLRPRPAVLWHLKIGGKGAEKKTSGGKSMRMPVKYDHFVVTKRERGQDDNLIKDHEIHERLGSEKPTEIDIRLPFDEPEDNLYAQLVQYDGRKRIWSCDGEEAVNLKTGVTGPCAKAEGKDCRCKPYGRFTFMLEASPTFGGFCVFRTTSWESVNNLQSGLRMFRDQFGSLKGLPLRLQLYPATDQYEAGGEVRQSTSYKVGLVLRFPLKEAAALALEFHEVQQLTSQRIRLLRSGLDQEIHRIEAEDEGHVAEEFFPDEDAVTSVATQDKVDALKEQLGVDEPPVVDAGVETVTNGVPTEDEIERVRVLMDDAEVDAGEGADIEMMIGMGNGAGVREKIAELEERLGKTQGQLEV